MGRCNAVYRLPPEVRAAVNARLAASGFTGYEALSDWLKESGHDISKSTLHRYAREIEARTPLPEVEFSDNAELRVRCVEAASAFYTEGDLIQLSADIYMWVTTGKRR